MHFWHIKAINNPDSVFYQADEDILHFNERYFNGELNILFNELNLPFSYEDVVKVCKQLKNDRSAGPDYLLNEFFKYGVTNVDFLNLICTLFNKLLSVGYFPEAWSEGYIVPLHKRGDINDIVK